MKSRKTHLINNKGEKLVVETREFNISQQNGDGKYDDYLEQKQEKRMKYVMMLYLNGRLN